MILCNADGCQFRINGECTKEKLILHWYNGALKIDCCDDILFPKGE